MQGKYFDNRVHPQFVTLYSKVPYLDSQIFNIQTHALKQSRRIKNRTTRAVEAIQRTREISLQLSNKMRSSRIEKEEQTNNFISCLRESNVRCLEKQKQSWLDYSAERKNDKNVYLKQQLYLDSLLTTNSSKAASRLTSVRRWQ